jgi:hypothetical protein
MELRQKAWKRVNHHGLPRDRICNQIAEQAPRGLEHLSENHGTNTPWLGCRIRSFPWVRHSSFHGYFHELEEIVDKEQSICIIKTAINAARPRPTTPTIYALCPLLGQHHPTIATLPP